MAPQIKLTVTQNDKIIQTVTKTIEQQYLIKSLEEFQVEANAALTKMIEELGEIGEVIGDANSDEDDDEDTDSNADSSQTTDMESKGHSKSKKIKHN